MRGSTAFAAPGRALAALILAGWLLSCSTAPGGWVEDERPDEGLYETQVREHVDAMQEGMARARLDLARRAIRRMLRGPG